MMTKAILNYFYHLYFISCQKNVVKNTHFPVLGIFLKWSLNCSKTFQITCGKKKYQTNIYMLKVNNRTLEKGVKYVQS